MAVVTSRDDFERLMELRLREAKLLLDAGDWDGAYYLAGYVVEFALKVRIIARLMQSNAYPERREVETFYKHDLTLLLALAGLDKDLAADVGVRQVWKDVISKWSEQARYEVGRPEVSARGLYDAIEKEVLPWIKARW